MSKPDLPNSSRRNFLAQAAGAALALVLPAGARTAAKPASSPRAAFASADEPTHRQVRARLSKLVENYSYPA